eukprot:6036036-Amphidinium_carterae.1
MESPRARELRAYVDAGAATPTSEPSAGAFDTLKLECLSTLMHWALGPAPQRSMSAEGGLLMAWG